MRLQSVNIGEARPLEGGPRPTGIYKQPADGPVTITPEGLAGDAVCDRKHHGGPDQAVYVYGAPDYAWWSEALGRPLAPGTFGENLTIEDLESADLLIGDALHVGSVVLQVTAPRIPCGTLAARMGDPRFVKRFREAERPGVYCRVLQPGALQAGDAVRHVPYEGERLTVRALFRDWFVSDLPEETIRLHLAVPLAVRARGYQEQQLARLLAARAG